MLITALATPFWHGKVDEESFERLLQGQRHADALLCCGTTGEGGNCCRQRKACALWICAKAAASPFGRL